MASTVKATGVLPISGEATPRDVSASEQGARLFYDADYAGALEQYGRLLTSRNTDPVVLYDYGTCLLHLSRYPEAIKTFSNAISINAKLPWPYFNRGVANQLNGNLTQAVTDYTAALKISPKNARGYNNLAIAMRDLGNLDQAQKYVATAISLDPHYAPAFFNSAKIQGASGDPISAQLEVAKGTMLALPVSDGSGLPGDVVFGGSAVGVVRPPVAVASPSVGPNPIFPKLFWQ
jgi:tetratricopeptide (TPR) repeat protein